ncbi:MAG: LAGLIDADG family homing endonuclease [Candidatus Aenigmatarchaeota archaeon]
MAYISEEKKDELTLRFNEFLRDRYSKDIEEASNSGTPLEVDFDWIQKFGKHGPELSELLLLDPKTFFQVAEDAVTQIDLPNPVRVRVKNLTELTSIRDLRSRHINKFLAVEGIVRKASEIRPEIMETEWECPECEEKLTIERRGNFMPKPFLCTGVIGGKPCRNRIGFKEVGKKMIDTRWMVIEEPFELTEGERPSQVTVVVTEDLVSPDGRRLTEPGNKLLLCGILKDIPKQNAQGVKLDFFLDVNNFEATEIGWEKLDINKEDEEKIKAFARDPKIYEKLVQSIAPSLYGLEYEKEAIIMQLFGGVTRKLRDRTRIRGDIHLLIIGDPASGKSQLLKLVPDIVPRGKYVSGKGTSTAGLTATVTKDEQFMGGWVLEAGAIVLANKGLLAIDEFEKMSQEDQVAMHEALEQGCYDGSTELIFEDGSKTQIGDFVDQLTQGEKGNNISKIISDKNIHILSSDFKQIKPSKILAVGKHTENSIYKINLNTGQEIKITKDHPVFIIRNGVITPIKARGLKKGDHIPVPKRLSLYGKPQPLPLQKIPEDKKHKKLKLPTRSSKELCEWIGLIIGEGNAEVNRKIKNGVCFSNNDQDILNRYKYLIKKLFSISPYVQTREKDSLEMIRLISRPLYRFIHSIGSQILVEPWNKSLPDWINKSSNEEISYLLRGLFDAEGSVNYPYGTITFSTTSENLAKHIRELLLRFEIFSGIYLDKSMKGNRKHVAYKLQLSGKENIKNFDKFIGFTGRRKHKLQKLVTKRTVSSVWNHVPNIVPLVEQIRKELNLSYDEIVGHELTLTRKKNNITKEMLRKIVKSFDSRIVKIEKTLEKLKSPIHYTEFRKLREEFRISRSEIARKLKISEQNLWYWKAVKKDEKLFKKSITVTENILEKMLSQKRIIENLRFVLEAPVEWIRIKSISLKRGKQWVYDVAMNPTGIFIGNGIICHNSVSIAKASIVATLPAQTSVLAGGNPKFSRFDPYMAISKQITISPTLLSRFDLKFALMDKPDTTMDKKVVDHILKSRDIEATDNTPTIDRDNIRKYIAYAKDKCKPELTAEVGKMLKNFYVSSRKRATTEGGGAIPLSLRQFEALIRISEASAKIQLSPVVRIEDAERAIKLMTYSLKQLGYDPETGQIDIDRSEGGVSSSERTKIRSILEIINELSTKKKEIAIGEIEELAKKEGIEEVDEIIDKLKREGMLYEPRPSFIQKV